MFYFLGVDKALLFGRLIVVLNYIPEIGHRVAGVLPCPVILLDGRVIPDMRLLNLFVSIIGQAFFKFVCGNMIELQIFQNDKEMKMHPVVVLFGIALFGFNWGPTGMIVCVPAMAVIKGISVDFESPVPNRLRSFVLQLLEGDLCAHERHSGSFPFLPYHVSGKERRDGP